MKSESEVKQKLVQLLGRNLEKEFQKKLGRKPSNCVHNHVHSSLVNRENRIEVEHTGLCMLNCEDPSSWEGRICETAADARFCPYFTPKNDKQKVYEEFMSKVKDLDSLQHEHRDILMLKWVLDDPSLSIKLSLWDRIKLFFRKDKIEKMQEPAASGNKEVESISEKLFDNRNDY